MIRFVQRHQDGVALAIGFIAMFAFCLAVVAAGISLGVGR